jgi:hypothetical protein
MDHDKRFFKKATGERAADVLYFQRTFVPSYKQMFKAMMCDVLAHVDVDECSHYVLRRPFWHNGNKQFQYGYVVVPYNSKAGRGAYHKMVESDDFWSGCYDIYSHLKEEMFDSLSEKQGVWYVLKDVARENYLSVPIAEFVAKAEAALDKK